MKSANAPFDEFGQSMILRDVEILYQRAAATDSAAAAAQASADTAQQTGASASAAAAQAEADAQSALSAVSSLFTPKYLTALGNTFETTASGTYASYYSVSGTLGAGTFSSGVFTAPSNGIYTFYACGQMAENVSGAGYVYFMMSLNGPQSFASSAYSYWTIATTGITGYFNLSGGLYMTAGQTMSVGYSMLSGGIYYGQQSRVTSFAIVQLTNT